MTSCSGAASVARSSLLALRRALMRRPQLRMLESSLMRKRPLESGPFAARVSLANELTGPPPPPQRGGNKINFNGRQSIGAWKSELRRRLQFAAGRRQLSLAASGPQLTRPLLGSTRLGPSRAEPPDGRRGGPHGARASLAHDAHVKWPARPPVGAAHLLPGRGRPATRDCSARMRGARSAAEAAEA